VEAVSLHVPDVGPDDDTIGAGIAYAAGGLYVLPVSRASKHAGSVLGKGWPAKSSRDPERIAAWFAGTDHALALHVGRSGAVVFDVDDPDQLPDVLARALEEIRPPFQSTRNTVPGRGHYVFACPADRMLGNSTGKLRGGWGEVRGRNGIVVVAPSDREKAAAGGRYLWQRTGLVPVLPDELSELLPDALDADDAATDAEVQAFLAEHMGNARPRALGGMLRLFADRVAAGESRHESAVAATVWALKEARCGYFPAAVAVAQIGAAFVASLKQERPSEYGGIVAWAVSQAKVADLDEVRRIADRPRADDPSDLADDGPTSSTPLDRVVKFVGQLQGWLDLPDPSHVLLVLAAAVTRNLDGEPVWLLLVAAPSSGKTEAVGLLDTVADGRLNDVTQAGLLGWSKGKTSVPTGLLARIGQAGLVTFGDLSSLLATSDRGGRDSVFGMLRRAYDGYVTRDIAPPAKTVDGNDRLVWAGRLTVAAAVTGAIDRYAAHSAELGPRWVQCRLPDRDLEAKRRAAARARDGKLAENRAAARETAAKLVTEAVARVDTIAVPTDIADAIEDAALVTCWGRASVPRHGYGRREIDGMPVVEEPPRLVRQLLALARGLLALGLPKQYVTELVRSTALDSMPDTRRLVLAALATGEPLKTVALGRTAGVHRHVARMQAEELEAIGVVLGERQGDDEEDDRRPVTWQLDGDDGDLIAKVFAAHGKCEGWHEVWLTHTRPPQKEDVDG
jgi:Bifunctional DNA primase/polymerase, N-terminal